MHGNYDTSGDAEAELQEKADNLVADLEMTDVLLIRRTWRLGLGEITSLVAASSPNIEGTFDACLGICDITASNLTQLSCCTVL